MHGQEKNNDINKWRGENLFRKLGGQKEKTREYQ
jgi:hypothetical protein